jgi:prepilin peptidase CpaA
MHNAIILELVLLVMLFLACAFDLRQRKSPNRLLALGLLISLALHLASGQPSHVLTMYLAGFGVGLVMFLPLYLMRGMAAGDVKLMATVGAFIGPGLAWQASLATYCAGGLLALAIVLFKKRGRAAFANVGNILHPMLMRMQGAQLAPQDPPVSSVGGMPYALAITAGTCVVLWIRHS